MTNSYQVDKSGRDEHCLETVETPHLSYRSSGTDIFLSMAIMVLSVVSSCVCLTYMLTRSLCLTAAIN